jgi:hypothetical protein
LPFQSLGSSSSKFVSVPITPSTLQCGAAADTSVTDVSLTSGSSGIASTLQVRPSVAVAISAAGLLRSGLEQAEGMNAAIVKATTQVALAATLLTPSKLVEPPHFLERSGPHDPQSGPLAVEALVSDANAACSGAGAAAVDAPRSSARETELGRRRPGAPSRRLPCED